MISRWKNGLTRALILAAGLVLAVPGAAAERPSRPDQLKFEPLTVKIPEPERIELSNGMVLYYMEDHSLPLVDMTMWFHSGSIYEPAEKAGLGAMTAAWARNGGAGGLSRMELDSRLEFLAAEMNVAIADEHGEAGLSVMTKDLEEGLRLLDAVLRKPAFDPGIFPLLQQSFARGILSRKDSPAGVLSEAFPPLLYGTHPYGRVPTMETLRAITREDCIDFWKRSLVPNGMIVGVAGDVTRDEIVAKLEAVFGDWPRGENTFTDPAPLERKYAGRLVVIPRTEGQSHVRMGSLAVKRTDPDRVVLDVMNLVLGGGGFSSRLTEVVRVRGGLAYDVGSFFTRQRDLGLFTASVQTKAETTYKAISLILDEIRRIRDEPVPADELEKAKDMVLNGIVFSYEKPFDVVDSQVSLEYYGYPRDWISKWRDTIASVTVEDVQRVAREYLRPDGLVIVVAGNPELFDARPEGLPEPETLK